MLILLIQFFIIYKLYFVIHANCKILLSILGMETGDLSALQYKVAQLSIKEGGLGLLNHSLVGKAAYVASIVGFHQKYLRVLLGNVNLSLIPQESVGQFILFSKSFCGTDKLSSSLYDENPEIYLFLFSDQVIYN